MQQVVDEAGLDWLDTPDQAVVWGTALGLQSEIEGVLARSLEDVKRGQTSGAVPVLPALVPELQRDAVHGPATGGSGGGIFSDSGIPDIGGMMSALGTIGNSPSSSGGSGGGGSQAVHRAVEAGARAAASSGSSAPVIGSRHRLMLDLAPPRPPLPLMPMDGISGRLVQKELLSAPRLCVAGAPPVDARLCRLRASKETTSRQGPEIKHQAARRPTGEPITATQGAPYPPNMSRQASRPSIVTGGRGRDRQRSAVIRKRCVSRATPSGREAAEPVLLVAERARDAVRGGVVEERLGLRDLRTQPVERETEHGRAHLLAEASALEARPSHDRCRRSA